VQFVAKTEWKVKEVGQVKVRIASRTGHRRRWGVKLPKRIAD
jgi:hypothetical protein